MNFAPFLLLLRNSLQRLQNNVPEAILFAGVYEKRATVNGPHRDFGSAGGGAQQGLVGQSGRKRVQ